MRKCRVDGELSHGRICPLSKSGHTVPILHPASTDIKITSYSADYGKEVFFMQSKAFKNVKIMCFCAMLTALSVAIAWLCKMFLTVTPYIRITFENLPLIMAGYFFGPIPGLLCGLASDIISTAISQYGLGGINPIITIGAGLVGLIAGSIPHLIGKKNGKVLFISVFAAHIVGNIIVKSAGLHIMYSWAIPLLYPRLPLYIVIAAIEFGIITVLLKNKVIAKVLNENDDIRRSN